MRDCVATGAPVLASILFHLTDLLTRGRRIAKAERMECLGGRSFGGIHVRFRLTKLLRRTIRFGVDLLFCRER